MAENITIGLQFNLDPGWMGGAYYLQNVLTALGTLEKSRQPHVVVIAHDRSSYEFLLESGYQNMSHATSQEVVDDLLHCGIDLMFPHPLPQTGLPTLTWIPDFQEKHLPHLFSKEELDGRRAWHESCFACEALMLSSESALTDLNHFYPEAKVPTFVVPFASFLPEEIPPYKKMSRKYDLPERYFFAPNQFWMHKNHIVILKAMQVLKERGVQPYLCFSGKEYDSRAGGYTDFLRAKIEQWGLQDQVKFLGFMPRDEQISVMKAAIAVIQPSRFEGWSTVVEDGKALNQYLIASNLDVHQEQLDKNAEFFHPSDFLRLGDIMERHWRNAQPRVNFDYRINQRRFGERLSSVFALVAAANADAVKARHSAAHAIRAVSSTIGADHVTGLSVRKSAVADEASVIRAQLWTDAGGMVISGKALDSGKPFLAVRFRNGQSGRKISLMVGERHVLQNIPLNDADFSESLEVIFDLSNFVHGAEDVKLNLSGGNGAERQGVIIERLEFLSAAEGG